MIFAVFALFVGIVGANAERRRLTLGDAHSGSNLHVRLGFNTLTEAMTHIVIDSMGGVYTSMDVGTIHYNASATPKATFTQVSPSPIYVFKDDCDICNNQIMIMSIDTCTFQVLTGDIVDLECPLLFNDGPDFATQRLHVPCSDGNCAELKTYSVNAQYDNVPDASSTMHFTSDCDSDADYHLLWDICVLDSCHRCENGHFCADTPGALGNCTLCEDGSDTRNASLAYVTEGASICQSCSSGRYQSGNAECTSCPTGSHTVDTNGTYVSSSAVGCDLCPIGKYRKISGDCVDCIDGRETGIGIDWSDSEFTFVTIGANNCRTCRMGKAQTGDDQCQQCPLGTQTEKYISGAWRWTQYGAQKCAGCQVGKYSRTYTSPASAAGQMKCLDCGDGRETTNGTYISTVAPRGEYSAHANVNATNCEWCVIGKWLKTEGGETKTACKECAAGHEVGYLSLSYAHLGGGTSCTACEIGKYSVDYACETCQSGFETQNGTGQFVETAASLCTACENGEYQTGTDACAVCTDGSDTRKNNAFVISGADQCVPCISDKYQSGNDECAPCTDGYETLDTLNDFVSIEATQCSACGSGKYQTGTDPCAQCPDGSDTRDVNGSFVTQVATQCTPCVFGKETQTLTSECSFVDCYTDPHKCRDTTSGACGNIGSVNCDGYCVNTVEFAPSMDACPVMYAAFPLHANVDASMANAESGKCGSATMTTTDTCVKWRGDLPNNFDLSQVEALTNQDSAFCNELRSLDDENNARSKAATCTPYFSVVAPVYVYPHVWNGTHNNLASEWVTFIASAKAHPRVRFDVIINPNNGEESTSVPNSSWQELLSELTAIANVKLFGYVPTAYGNSSVSTQVSSYISGYATNWNINDIFFDEVNGHFSGSVTRPSYASYSTSVAGSTICNMGSPIDANGTPYDSLWFTQGSEICTLSILLEHEASELENYSKISDQTGFPRDNFGAIMHTTSSTQFVDFLDDAFDQRFGSVFLTPGSGSNPYVQMFDSSNWVNFVKAIDDWSIFARNGRHQ